MRRGRVELRAERDLDFLQNWTRHYCFRYAISAAGDIQSSNVLAEELSIVDGTGFDDDWTEGVFD